MSLNLNGRSILITGGTGSFGQAFTQIVLDRWPNIERLVIFSRDEQKQHIMAQKYPPDKFPNLRFFIGDVRDYERLRRAFARVEYVVHAAAMKHVHIAEYNPDECVKTNIGGAQNVIRATLESDVERVVALSTDKACAPISLYGATKLASDKLFIAANNIRGLKQSVFSVVRYGNVLGSNGSVVPHFLRIRKSNRLTITDPAMTRFNISLDDGVQMVLDALDEAWGGEIFVPKIPSFRILDLAEAVAPEATLEVIGIRPGEKVHEEMISSSDSYSTYDLGAKYAILPQVPQWSLEEFVEQRGAKKIEPGFSYNSASNESWLSVTELRALIRRHVDADFELN